MGARISVFGRTVARGTSHVLHTDPSSPAMQNGGMAVEATNENYYGRTIDRPNVIVSRCALDVGRSFGYTFKPYSVTVLELDVR